MLGLAYGLPGKWLRTTGGPWTTGWEYRWSRVTYRDYSKTNLNSGIPSLLRLLLHSNELVS